MAVRHRARPSEARRSVRRALLGVTVVLGVVAVLVLALVRGDGDGGGDTTVRDTSAASTPPPATSGAAEASPAAQPRAAPDARPEHLTISDIGVSTDLLRLGLNPDQTVEVPQPQDAALAGWFDQGPAPGQVGSSVLLGHVDSVDGPAVFYRLKELRPGSPVEVRLDDGSVARFKVTRTATYDNEEFPAQEVYAGSPGRATLKLVTCGGDYDAERGGWQSNVVVYTSLVRIIPA